MKFFILFLLISLNVHSYAEEVCTYDCPSLSYGHVETFGHVRDILKSGSHLSLSFTPKYGIESFNQKIADKQIPFLSDFKLSFSA